MRYITTLVLLSITSIASSQQIMFSIGMKEMPETIVVAPSQVPDIYPSPFDFVSNWHPTFPGRGNP